MKKLRKALSGLGLVATLLFAGAAGAAVIQITVDTSSVNGASGWVVFDLIDGSDGPGTSSVAITGFTPAGGLGSTIVATVGATGTLPTVTLNDAEFFNEYLQDITLGDSISFTFETSGALGAPTPDGFSFLLLARCDATPTAPTVANDCIEFESLLPTSDPTGAGALFLFNIGGGFEGGQPYAESVTPTALPEPGSLALAVAALFALGAPARVRKCRSMPVPKASMS